MIKYGDGKAQAFNKWFKEYVMNVILQPVHLILYMSLVGAASDLVTRNPIYALVAIAFLIPAEKFIKDMFGLNKASSTSDFGSFAKNALALKGMQSIGKALSGGGGKSSKALGGAANSKDVENSKFNKIKRAELGAYAANKGDNKAIDDDDEPTLIGNNQQDENRNGENLDSKPNNQAEWIAQQKQKDLERGFELPESYYLSGAEQWNKEKEEQDRLAMQQAQEQEQERQRSKNPNQRREGWGKRLAIRGVKSGAKAGAKAIYRGAKIGVKAAGAAGGAAIGLASALATGDASNIGKYTLTGATAGGAIGSFASQVPEKAFNAGKATYDETRSLGDNISNVVNEEMYGYSAARDNRIQKENQRARREFLKDKDQIAKYTDIASQIGYDVNNKEDLKKFMNAAADYKELGVSDDMIKQALKAENKGDSTVGGSNHQKMLDVASLATNNGYTKSDILSNKSRSDMEDMVEAQVAASDRYEVMQNIADLYGAGEFYSKVSRFNKSNNSTVNTKNAVDNKAAPKNTRTTKKG